MAAFRASRIYGESTQLRIDEAQRKFMVSRTSNYSEENPDVIDLSQVTNCTLDVSEFKHELKQRDRDGAEAGTVAGAVPAVLLAVVFRVTPPHSRLASTRA